MAVQESPAVRTGGRLLRILVAVTQDDPKAADVHFEDYAAAGGTLAAVYADPDLGPKLRAPAFDALRTKFPPPK